MSAADRTLEEGGAIPALQSNTGPIGPGMRRATMKTMEVDDGVFEEGRALEARVEKARQWTPKELVRLMLSMTGMVREVVPELSFRAAVASDLHNDVYPGNGCDCDPECATCRDADELAGKDGLVLMLAGLSRVEEVVDELAEVASYFPGPNDPLWVELERRLQGVPKRSSDWVELQERLRQAAAAAAAEPSPDPDAGAAAQ